MLLNKNKFKFLPCFSLVLFAGIFFFSALKSVVFASAKSFKNRKIKTLAKFKYCNKYKDQLGIFQEQVQTFFRKFIAAKSICERICHQIIPVNLFDFWNNEYFLTVHMAEFLINLPESLWLMRSFHISTCLIAQGQKLVTIKLFQNIEQNFKMRIRKINWTTFPNVFMTSLSWRQRRC